MGYNFTKNKNSNGKIIGIGILVCTMIMTVFLIKIMLITPIGTYEFVIEPSLGKDFSYTTASDTKIVEISIPNTPPYAPVISGTMMGKKGESYDYEFVSIDIDGDDLQYNITWGDGNSNTTNFYPNATVVTKSHSFSIAGVYKISVYAFDNNTKSNTTFFEVLISACWVKEKGYLIDYDGDEVYEMFYSNATDGETDTEKRKDGKYLVNEDGDGEWDFVYEIETDTMAPYIASDVEEADYTYLYLLIILIIIIFIIIGYLVDKNEKKHEPQKPESKKNSEKNKTPKKKN